MSRVIFSVLVLVVVSFFSTCVTSAPQRRPHISGIRIEGQPILVFDHLKDKEEANELPDTQAHAWKESDGTVNVTISHFENYRMRGADIEHITSDPKKIFSSTSSASDIVESHYNFHHWLAAPYTLDGKTIYALAHSEWYACLLNDDCSKPSVATQAISEGNQMNSWTNSLSSFKSVDGGASWVLNGSNDAHVVGKESFYWTGTQALVSNAYQKAFNHTGLMTPSRIIKEGSYYYSIGYFVHRDFSRLDPATGQAPSDKFGFELIRTTDLTQPSSWEAWISGTHFEPLANGGYAIFRPKKNGIDLQATQLQMIYDTNATVFVAIFTQGEKGAIYYMTTPSLANPSWSEAVAISGTDTFQKDPRSPRQNLICNKGFSSNNYVSLIDSHSAGLNFEFTSGHPWLFYVTNPAECGGDNLARDLYRVLLFFDYK